MSKDQHPGEKIRRGEMMTSQGRLLVAESCRSFIESSVVRALFRHPMAAQKTADEYLAMVRSCGFEVPESGVAMSSPWWSQPDLGLRERLGWSRVDSGDATEIMLVARKSAG